MPHVVAPSRSSSCPTDRTPDGRQPTHGLGLGRVRPPEAESHSEKGWRRYDEAAASVVNERRTASSGCRGLRASRPGGVEIVGGVAGCPGCGEAAAEMVGMVDEVSQ